jgi:hydrogenase nickel incorporation protein HypB
MCHLEAKKIAAHFEGWDLATLDFLFIEIVGNPVCPSGYDLGQAMRVVLLSIIEGEDKPLKYPPPLNSVNLAVITKMDLAEAAEFNRVEAHTNIQAVCPGVPILETSAKTGAGVQAWLDFLVSQRD